MTDKKINLTTENFATLAICAIRYSMGRETYMPGLVRDIIRPHLADLDETDLNVMLQDSAEQRRYNNYGSSYIDKPGWLQWETELNMEKARRERGGGKP